VGAKPQHVFGIDSAPAHVRQAAIDKLLAGESSRAVSQYLLQHGLKISHNSVARYNRLVLLPALETGAKLQQIHSLTAKNPEDVPSQIDLTKAALAADPILSRVQKKYSNYDLMISAAIQDEDYKGFSAVDRAETAALTLHAQLTGRLQQSGPTTNVQIVFNGTPPQNTPNPVSIDAEFVDLTPINQQG
jgi:hypothetical protein